MSKKSFKDKPYITSGIKVSLKTKYRLYEKYLNNPNDVNKAAWKRFRNKTSEIIKRAEELYYKKILVVTIIVVRSTGKHLAKFIITIKSNIISLLILKSMD